MAAKFSFQKKEAGGRRQEAIRGIRGAQKRKRGEVNSPSSLKRAGTGGWASRSAPPQLAPPPPPPPRGGARGGRGSGRRRAGPRHTPRTRAGSAARGAAPEFPRQGPSRGCAAHPGLWRRLPASEHTPRAGEAAPARSPTAAQARSVFASACHCRLPAGEGSLLNRQAPAAASVASQVSPAPGDLPAHFPRSLPDSRPRALGLPKGTSCPPHLAGRGCEVKFPAPSPVRLGPPLPRSLRADWSPEVRLLPRTALRARSGGALAPRVGAARGPRASGRRCVRPPPRRSGARRAAGVAGASAGLALPRPAGLRKFGVGCTVLRGPSARPPARLSAGSSDPRLRGASSPAPRPAFCPRAPGGSAPRTLSGGGAFSPAARAQTSLFLPLKCVNMGTPPASLRYRGAQPSPPAALFL